MIEIHKPRSIDNVLLRRVTPTSHLLRETMASLVLDDGTIFEGKNFGALRNVPGEIGKK